MAECVQPAPCVARDRVPLDGDLDVPLAVEEVVDRRRAMAAGDDDGRRAQLMQPLGQLDARAVAPVSATASIRFGVITAASGNSRDDERVDGVRLEQRRAGARDHHRVDDERHGMRCSR